MSRALGSVLQTYKLNTCNFHFAVLGARERRKVYFHKYYITVHFVKKLLSKKGFGEVLNTIEA